MAEDQKTPEGAKTGAEAKTYTAEETQLYIAQLREENRQRRLEVESMQKAQADRDRAEKERETKLLAEQGEYKKLYETLAADHGKVVEAAKERDAYKSAFEASLQKRIADIPEGMRSLVPTGYTPLQLSQWLDDNAALLAGRRAPNLDPGAGGSGSGGSGTPVQLTPDDLELARRFNMTPEAWAKRKAEIERTKGSK